MPRVTESDHPIMTMVRAAQNWSNPMPTDTPEPDDACHSRLLDARHSRLLSEARRIAADVWPPGTIRRLPSTEHVEALLEEIARLEARLVARRATMVHCADLLRGGGA